MKKINMFWPVYKNLERVVQQLADRIHFTDNQVKVYSLYIADLLVRTVVEIEAIAKELYYEICENKEVFDDNGKSRDLYFDTDCLKLLNEKWKLSSKQVIVSSSNFYFCLEENKVLMPLKKSDKRGDSGSKWKQAYQAVKHDRMKSLEKATIKNLLNAMAALYILNLYYRDENITIGRDYVNIKEFDNSAGSEIFSVLCYEATFFKISLNMDDSCIVQFQDNSLDDSVYIIKNDDYSYMEMHKEYCLEMKTLYNLKKELQTQDELSSVYEEVGERLGSIPKDIAAGCEIILNKGMRIYPYLSPNDVSE